MAVLWGALAAFATAAGEFQASWEQEPDRVWIGPDFWASRMADWSLQGGRAVCRAEQDAGETRSSRLNLLTRRIGDGEGNVEGGLSFAPLDPDKPVEIGFRLGAEEIVLATDGGSGPFRFGVEAEPDGAAARMSARIRDGAGTIVAEWTGTVEGTRLSGPVSVVVRTGGARGAVGIDEVTLRGARLAGMPEAAFGPVAGALHTLSRGTLKITAQMVPLGEDEPDRAFLEREAEDGWETIGESEIETPGWTATFRVPDWDGSRDWSYRIVYGESAWAGTIRRDPVERDGLTVGVLADSGGWDRGAEAFPGTGNGAVAGWVAAVREQGPDLVFFPGGQVRWSVEERGAGGEVLDYVQRWCEWHAVHAPLTREVPCVTLPGDGDLFQRGLWGEGGRPTLSEPFGGYRQPAEFLRMVFRTQTSHLPDPADENPAKQDLPACFGDLRYGRASFAILEDRKWKSGFQALDLPAPESGEAGWLPESSLDPRQLDVPGLKLLGDRQLEFLEAWAGDWEGADFKVVLSETMFAQMGTHHGVPPVGIGLDLGSNGWPQSGRKQALEVWHRAGAIHVCADGGLASVVRHGIEGHDDAGPAFAAPSLFPVRVRDWRPRSTGLGRDADDPFWKGKHLDGLRNPVTVLAVAGPDPAGRMPRGFGIVRLQRETGASSVEAWLAGGESDAQGEAPGWVQAEGWPVSLTGESGGGEAPRSWLPPLEVNGVVHPVVLIRSVAAEKLVYARRMTSPTFTPWVPEPGRYDVRIGDPDTGTWIELKGIEAAAVPYREARIIEF